MRKTLAHATAQHLPSCGAEKAQFNVVSRAEFLWKKFFRDSSQWWDNRSVNRNTNHPDFKHKATGEALWISNGKTPSWVHAELRSRGLCGTTSFDQVLLYTILLKSCSRQKDLVEGTRTHHALVQLGLVEKCSDALVTMYASCGELEKAKALLDIHRSKDVITWTSVIAGYVTKGQGQHALNCFETMQHEGILPNVVTYICTVKACAVIRALDRGEEIHKQIRRQGWLQDNTLDNALVSMYAKCGAILQARQVLEKIPARNVVSWHACIAGCAETGEDAQAVFCLQQMQNEGILPQALSYGLAIKACVATRARDRRKQLNKEITRYRAVLYLSNCGADSEA